MFERIDREILEAAYAETLEMMSPEEATELERRQATEREQDYYELAMEDLRERTNQ